MRPGLQSFQIDQFLATGFEPRAKRVRGRSQIGHNQPVAVTLQFLTEYENRGSDKLSGFAGI